jgi:DNA-binding transcriptional regulator YiaG
MTPAEVRDARATLGEMWGYGRPLYASELARALELTGRDPGRTVRDWEREERSPTGPARVAIRAFLAGYRPDWVSGQT